MINEIFNLVEKYAGDVITNNPEVPEAKKGVAIEATANAVKDGIKGYLNPSNIGALAGMLSGNHSSSESNSIVNTLTKSVISSLTTKAGLSSATSSGIASALIPMLVSVVSKKMNDPKDSTFDLQSLISAFTQGNSSQGGSILGAIEGLFHK